MKETQTATEPAIAYAYSIREVSGRNCFSVVVVGAMVEGIILHVSHSAELFVDVVLRTSSGAGLARNGLATNGIINEPTPNPPCSRCNGEADFSSHILMISFCPAEIGNGQNIYCAFLISGTGFLSTA